ncbi:LysR family transcriptional regulator [Nocardioides humi]|uniref:LysR substrate-binding domain-containing protein n=1 Tax=Nocardioides humi TaxID=449461 RepID=A0ABN2A5P5_9ACTN|nr:LysR family transcriptional regulator [Nocardioides humi]
MRIEQLEYIDAITRHGSLRRASEHLHISQPALSESIMRLERELGVTLLDRRRSGARISRRGRDLLPHIVDAIDAVQRIRAAAREQAAAARVIHVGTVQAASSTLLIPAVRRFRAASPEVTVELRNMQQSEIFAEIAAGSLDLGLVNVLEGDDVPPDVARADLIHGRPVAVLTPDHPLAARDTLTADDLRPEPFVEMRPGYLMNRFAHRWFGPAMPEVCYTADGAELGKALVAQGIGFTLLPDFTVMGHPLEQSGMITYRAIDGEPPTVTLVACTRRGVPQPEVVRGLHAALVRRARDYTRYAAPA